MSNQTGLKIVVTGANGFVGKALCQKLIIDGHQVTALTRTPWHFSGVNNQVISDYSNPDLVNLLKGHDCIIHLAAKTHSGTKATQKNLAAYRAINLELSEILAQAAITAGISRFIYLSSIKVNGEQTFDNSFCHTDTPKPEDAYGISKLEAEQSLRVISSGTNMELIIVRPPLIWSRNHIKGNLNILKKWGDLGLPLPLGGVNNKRDLISIHNLCDFLSVCIGHPNVAGKTFLVSDGLVRNARDIALLVCKSSKTVSLPVWIHKVMATTGIGKKLFGNLQIDINYTTSTTGWRPTNSY